MDTGILFVSVISLGEIRKGIQTIKDPKRAAVLEAWLTSDLPSQLGNRILAIDREVADRWGRLSAAATTATRLPPIDSLIAATALHYDLSVVTRNEADFRPMGVPVTNPWT